MQPVLMEIANFPQSHYTDRRESARIVLALDVDLQLEQTDKIIKSSSSNINMDGSGMLVKANEELSPGQRLTLKISLSRGEQPVRCEGVVAYCYESPLIFKRCEQVYQIGISIDKIDYQNLSRFHKFITEKMYS